MAITWEALDLAGPPIQGDAVEYQQLEDEFGQVKQRMIELDQEFDSIRLGSGWSFSGSAADQFAAQLKPVATAVELLPSITTQVETIFQNHRIKLEQLQSAADSALARAQTRWNQQQQAKSSRSYHRREADRLNGQLECLEDESARPHIFGLWQYSMSCFSDADSNVQNSETALEESRTEWNTLRTSEQQLDEETASSLRSVELWSLSDPSLVDKGLNAVRDFLSSAWETMKDLGEFIFSTEFLLFLHEVFELYIIYMLVVMIVIAGVLAATTGIGGALVFPMAIVAAAAFTKLMIGFELHDRGQISGRQLATDGLDFALSITALSLHFMGVAAAARGLAGLAHRLTSVERGLLGFELMRSGGGKLLDWQFNTHKLPPATISDADKSNRERSGRMSDTDPTATSISTIRVEGFNVEEDDLIGDSGSGPSFVPVDSHFEFNPPSIVSRSFEYSFRDFRPVIVPSALGD